MDRPRFEHGSAGYPISVEGLSVTEAKSAERPGMRTGYSVAVAKKDRRVQCFAQTGGISDDRVQNRLKIARRFADDAQDLRGRRLLLQRLGKIARARLHLVEQAHIFDRNDRLVCKGLKEVHLTFGEGTGGCSRDRNHPDGLPLAEHWHAQDAPVARRLREPPVHVIGILPNVRDVGDCPSQYRSVHHAAWGAAALGTPGGAPRYQQDRPACKWKRVASDRRRTVR